MIKKDRNDLSMDEFYDLRYIKQMNLTDIAKVKCMSVSSVSILFKKYREVDPQRFLSMGKRGNKLGLMERWPIEKAKDEWLVYSGAELAQKYNVTRNQIYHAISVYRKKCPDQFCREKVTLSFFDIEGKTVNQVAKEKNISPFHVKLFRKENKIQKRPLSQYLTGETLQELIDTGVTLDEIALHYKTGWRNVRKFAVQQGVRFAEKKRHKPTVLSSEQKERLYRLHSDENLKTWEIAETMNLPVKKVENEIYLFRKRLGMTNKRRGVRPPKRYLEELYIISGLSVAEIATQFSCSIEEVQSWIRLYRIR